MPRPLLPAIALFCCLTSAAIGQEEPEDFPPGLLAEYRTGDQTRQVIDYDLSFHWGPRAPDTRLATGPFTAEWNGNLLARQPGEHVFHANVTGDLVIEIDGDRVFERRDAAGFVSGSPVSLRAGDHVIRIQYRSPQKSDRRDAQLAVFWSSDRFTLEPIPADVLFREEPSDVWTERQGRILTDAFRCTACHDSGAAVKPLAAPALDRVHGSQSEQVLVQRLQQPKAVVANSHMPDFGFSDREAQDVAAFLASVSKKAQSADRIRFKDGDVAAGHKLLNSLGCVACHQVPTAKKIAPPAEPYDAPELVHVAQRRSTAWLDRWLRDPSSLNVDHRMPVFELNKEERRQLVAALSDGKQVAEPEPLRLQQASIAAGQALVKAANCAACHRIPRIEATTHKALLATKFTDDDHCLAAANQNHADTARRPSYAALDQDRQAAIQSWVNSADQQSPATAERHGEVLLQRNGCTACHDRNLTRGLSGLTADLQKTHPELSGRSQGLVPPSLTAVGDKLLDDYLHRAVAGEQKERRLPWLLVRMPKFKHTDQERELIKQYLKINDRIPDSADAQRQDVLAHVPLSSDKPATAQQLLLGNQLTGAGGFNCVACHKAGPFEPRNVALGTRGSDLMTMRQRLRPRFFQRWMKNPIRVVPGIEMPAIKKGIPGVLDQSVPKQIAAIWTALRDPNFTPPTVTSRFEQVVNVPAGTPPKIIRDVFTIGLDRDRTPVARAMAVGFDNGHNLLLDLDRMQLRLWTVGEFARQRTEGKSWYWDMPGLSLYQNSGQPVPTLRLNGSELVAIEDEGRLAELLEYEVAGETVRLQVAWYFGVSDLQAAPQDSQQPHFTKSRWEQLGSKLYRVETLHELQAVADDEAGTTGWQQKVTLLSAPPQSEFRISSLLPTQQQLTATAPVRLIYTAAADSIRKDDSTALTVLAEQTVLPTRRPPATPPLVASPDQITSTPGFVGTRLPIDSSIMPTAMTWLPDGRMAFTSLKGHVWIASDSDKDGLPDRLQLFEEGLAAPFGIVHDNGSLIVSHKPEILKLRDDDQDGRVDVREVFASGWGFNDNYHDWASGLVRDADGNLYVGLGSDYSQKSRPSSQDRWRGGVIRIDPSGVVTPLAMSMRYPMGLAFDGHGNLFATDNQGVQNTFNEINHILPGRHYGVPSRHQPTENLPHETPALMVPHPWTRSVNSIVFLPEDFPVRELRGHGIGCEYDSRFLMRFTVQDVGGTLQGASYRFSRPEQEAGGSNFIGPICSAVSPAGELYIGSIWDSGWQGGLNTGGMTRLVPSPEGLPNGIREVRATADGFEVEFFRPVDARLAADRGHWSLQGYTREWGGSYATPDSKRYSPTISNATAVKDRVVKLTVKDLRPLYLYDIAAIGSLAEHQTLWPSEAHYSMKIVPGKK